MGQGHDGLFATDVCCEHIAFGRLISLFEVFGQIRHPKVTRLLESL